MFGIGLAELAVIALVAMIVLGPDRLPEVARQSGQFIRQLRQMANRARDDLRDELGPDYADLELRDLDPRSIVRKHVQEAWNDESDTPGGTTSARTSSPTARQAEGPSVPLTKSGEGLAPGEEPPYDDEAT